MAFTVEGHTAQMTGAFWFIVTEDNNGVKVDGTDFYFDHEDATLEAERRNGIQQRLEYLRGELQAERISQGELIELQGLAEHIEPGDVELLEAAGIPEFEEPPIEVYDDGDLNEVEQGRRDRADFYRNRDYRWF
jgi:hypothetical protein